MTSFAHRAIRKDGVLTEQEAVQVAPPQPDLATARLNLPTTDGDMVKVGTEWYRFDLALNDLVLNSDTVGDVTDANKDTAMGKMDEVSFNAKRRFIYTDPSGKAIAYRPKPGLSFAAYTAAATFEDSHQTLGSTAVDIVALTQAQVENEADVTAGSVSGERIKQAIDKHRPLQLDAGAPVVVGVTYATEHILQLTIPATGGPFIDVNGDAASNGTEPLAMVPVGWVQAATDITPAEFALVNMAEANSAAAQTIAKNILEFVTGDVNPLEGYQEDLSGADGRYYLISTAAAATAKITFKPLATYVAEGVQRIRVGCQDWSLRVGAVGVYETNGAEIISASAGFPDSSSSFLDFVIDAANNQFILMTEGQVRIDEVIPSFSDNVDAGAANLPPGSLFQGDATGDLGDNLFRVKADGMRVQV